MHSIPSFGFVITEQDEPGKLDAHHLRELGIPPGPLYARIKKGETVTLPSGKTVSLFGFIEKIMNCRLNIFLSKVIYITIKAKLNS
jgi:ribonuclease BN (tRNA processing enzyme)